MPTSFSTASPLFYGTITILQPNSLSQLHTCTPPIIYYSSTISVTITPFKSPSNHILPCPINWKNHAVNTHLLLHAYSCTKNSKRIRGCLEHHLIAGVIHGHITIILLRVLTSSEYMKLNNFLGPWFQSLSIKLMTLMSCSGTEYQVLLLLRNIM